MKVCDLTQFYSPVSGGVKRYIEQKAAWMRKHRPDDEHILVIPGETTGHTGDEKTRVYTVASPLVSRTSRYRALIKLHLVEEVLEKERPDIIESGDPYQLAWKAVASGRALSIPVVGFYHSHFPEAVLRSVAKHFGRLAVSMAEDAGRRYVKSLYNRFERTLVPSPVLASLLESWGVENTTPMDLGVDTEIFRPLDTGSGEIRREFDIPADRRLLLYVGRLAPEKNVRTMLDAFEILHARHSGRYHLLSVGDGTQRGLLHRLRDATGAVACMQFCQDAHRLADIYRAADLFVHPGVQETFGLVTLESQACGTPVIGIRGSYMDRIIFSQQTQWATENTPAALADAIEAKFTLDLKEAGRMASEAVRQKYSWKSVFERLFAVYDDVITGYSK